MKRKTPKGHQVPARLVGEGNVAVRNVDLTALDDIANAITVVAKMEDRVWVEGEFVATGWALHGNESKTPAGLACLLRKFDQCGLVDPRCWPDNRTGSAVKKNGFVDLGATDLCDPPGTPHNRCDFAGESRAEFDDLNVAGQAFAIEVAKSPLQIVIAPVHRQGPHIRGEIDSGTQSLEIT